MGLSDYTAQELLDELERRGKAVMERPEPKEPPDWNRLYSMVVDYISDVEKSMENKNETSLDKWNHYLMEAAVEAVYGKDIWKWVNPILSGG